MIGSSSTGVGTLNVLGGSNTFATASNDRILIAISGRGSLLAGGGTNSAVGIELADSTGGVGEMTLTNGLWNVGEHMWVGYFGTGVFTVNGGKMHFLNVGGPVLAVGRNTGATGMVTVAGGLLDVNGAVWLGGGANALARLTLSGNGVLKTKTIMEKDAAAISQIVFDGGKLQAAAAGTLIQPLDDVRLTANGMVIDSAGYNVSVIPALKNAADEAGGITKRGAGTLTLAGTRAATGPVSVLEGTLVVSNDVAVTAGLSRIDGTLAQASGARLIVGADAALSGTGTVARLTLQDQAVFSRNKADGSLGPLRVGDCVADNRLTIALTGYSLEELSVSKPLLQVPAAFMDLSKVTVTLNGLANPFLRAKFVSDDGHYILSASYCSGTMILLF